MVKKNKSIKISNIALIAALILIFACFLLYGIRNVTVCNNIKNDELKEYQGNVEITTENRTRNTKRMMNHKKQRGQRRKIKNLLFNIEQITPFADTSDRYEHFHVPSDQFISSPKTSGKLKTAFCEAWLQKTTKIIEQKPKDIPFCKVVAVIDEGDLWESQIIVFYDEDYYYSFWERSSTEQTWLPIDSDTRSFSKERNIKTSLKEKAYIEILSDEDIQRKTVLWFYGENK